jgi:hypothetical protein
VERAGPVGAVGSSGFWLEWEQAGVRSRLPLSRPLTIGRDASCDVRLAEPTVSRRHAVVSIVGGSPFVDASTSTNGITLDRGRASQVALSPGQSFRIGGTVFRVVGGPAVAAQVPQPAAAPRASAAFPRAPGPAGNAVPVIAIALVAVLAVGAVLGVAIIHPWSSTNQPQAAALAAPSPDPDAPSFPVPADSSRLNAQMDGSGPSAYRIASWLSGQTYDATVAFYTGLSDSRWHPSGSPPTTPDAADFTFSDGSGVFASAKLEVSRTNPVKIDVRFLPPGGVPARSYAPSPTIAFGPLPAATSLPDGFPSAFVPAGTTLVDASAVGSTFLAIFSGSIDPAVYQRQLASAATVTGTRVESGASVIDFAYDGNPGEAVVDPASGQVSIEVTK